jgi:hypothetical protein
MYLNYFFILRIRIFCNWKIFILKKRVTSSTVLPTSSANGLAATAINFGVNDRGCLPVMDSVAATQTQNAYLKLASQGTFDATEAQADLSAYHNLLCSTSGVCCYTNLCNESTRLRMSDITYCLSALIYCLFFLIL